MNKKFIGVLLGVLLVIYFGLSIYFTKHFYFGSNINGINVTGKTVEEVEKQMKANVNEYTLNLKEPGGKNEQIKATDIGLNYDSEGQVQGLKDNQNPFGWVIALFNTKNSEMTNKVSYDKKLLIECLDKSSFLTSGDVTESKNPSIKYTDKGYVIVNEVEGTKVNKDMLYTQLETEIVKGKTTTDLDVINCFAKPQYTSNSPEIIEAKNILNKYVNSKITYTFGNRKEVLDGSTINKWLKVSEDFKVTLDEAKSQKYLNELSTTYSTVEKTHDFVTTAGKSIQVKGGDYGWKINVTKEIQALIKTIKEGQTIAKEPAYTQTALSHDKNDIGKTYVEVDMSRQHLWFYKNGSLVVQGILLQVT